MPTDTFEHTATTGVELSAVWSQLQEPETWAAMGGIEEITNVRVESGFLQGFDFVTRIAGTPYRGTAATVESVLGQRMVVEVDTTELTAKLTVELAPTEAATRLDITMALTAKGFLASMMWGLVAASVGSGLPARTAAMVASFD